MGFNSQAGQVGFAVQAVKGTRLAATRFARLRSGGLGGARELLVPDPEIGGNRDIQQAYLGPISYAGEFEFYARMEMLALLFYGAFGDADSSAGGAAGAEVQTVTISGTPTGGTFTLTYRGQTTAAIAYNAIASAVDTALEALTTIGAGNVAVTGGPGPGTPYIVTFGGALTNTNIRPLTANSSGLTGGTDPDVSVAETTAGSAGVGIHTITPADTIPWLSVEERIGTSLESFAYTDAKVSSVRIECEANGYMTGTVGLLALTQAAGFTAQTTPAWDTSPMMVGSQVNVRFNDEMLPAKSFNFELNNNIEDDDFRLGSLTLGDLTPKRREVMMGVTIRPEDSALWRAATYGDTALTSPRGGPAYEGSLEVTISSYENIAGVGTPYKLVLTVPTVVMSPFTMEPSGDDIIEHDIEIRAIRPDPVVPIATAVITNGLAAVN